VLSGEKQRVERAYDFIQVCGWFAARCDLILLLFDPYKLDISDEFKAVISTLRGHDDKVRIVLNKSDAVDQQQLMRVYGALMWSLGKVFRSPEVCRVYIGRWGSGPCQGVEGSCCPSAAPWTLAARGERLLVRAAGLKASSSISASLLPTNPAPPRPANPTFQPMPSPQLQRGAPHPRGRQPHRPLAV
jgi:hypothetical protein